MLYATAPGDLALEGGGPGRRRPSRQAVRVRYARESGSRMDREQWMYGIDRSGINYIQHVQEFLKVAEKHRSDTKSTAIICPCVDCRNFDAIIDSRVILGHLIMRGFTPGYTCWTNHGEHSVGDIGLTIEGHVDTHEEYGNFSEDQASRLREILLREHETPLYPGSSDNRLSCTTELLRFKAGNGWSNKSFTDLVNFLADKLPEGNVMPKSTAEAKKILCPIELKYERIHACPNDCIIYWGKYKENESCLICETSRYKKKDRPEELEGKEKKKIPAKVFWYFPVIPRLERLFANPAHAKLLRWHAEQRKKDGKLRHPADASQWREIDSMYEMFGKEPRNIRFALSTDGMNPFGNMTTTHSTWPVLLSIYNLPPWLYMKRKYIMLSVLIPGPRQPGNDIDVYLEPLVEDLLKLWETEWTSRLALVAVYIIYCHAWKDFKWKLNLHYVKKEKTPFQDYPTLKEEWWPGFVEWVTSDEYIALGEKGKKSQSKHEFRQRLGRRSYAVQKKQWAKEDAQALNGRHKDWARAMNPSGDAKITESHPIIKKIVDVNAKSVAGTFTPADNMDILATALGSNHPGRTTGVSAYVGLGTGLAEGDASRKKKRTRTKELVKKLEEEYNAKFAELRAMLSKHEVTKCKLVVHIGPQSVVVARGQAFPPKDVQTVHGIERRDEHTRVQVDFVFDNFMEYPLPVPITDDDIFTLGDAKNSFVLWPKSGIKETTVHTNPQNLARASPPLPDILANQDKIPTQTVGANIMDVTPSASNDSKKRKHKHKKHKDKKNKKHSISKPMNTEDDDGLDPLWNPPLRQRSPSPIPVDKEFVLGQPFTSSALLKKMGKQSQRFHKWYLAMTTRRPRRQLATHFMVRYMRKIDKYRGVVGFLDPEMVLQRRIAQEADEVGAYIVKALLAQQDKECIFVGRIGFATSPLLPEEIANVRGRLLDFFMTE
ncbi:hypothetical protein U9M48_031540, partial [Paspalum notatum var. saurae]